MISNLLADQGFAMMGCVSFFVALFYLFQFYDYAARFFGMLFSRIRYSTTLVGKENVPENPALYLCEQTSWCDTLLILGVQRRRVRFLIQKDQEHAPLENRVYKALRVAFVPEIEDYTNPATTEIVAQSLRKGISLVLFTNTRNFAEEIGKIVSSKEMRIALRKNASPIIPIHIDRSEPSSRFRIPATVTLDSPVYLNDSE